MECANIPHYQIAYDQGTSSEKTNKNTKTSQVFRD